MVNAVPILIILSLLPFSFSVLLLPPPSIAHDQHIRIRDLPPDRCASCDTADSAASIKTRWLPRRPKGLLKRDRRERPELRVGGVEVDLHVQQKAGLEKRSQGIGTVSPLGTVLDTYVVPIMIGDPPVGYPLQLDLASSDLILASTLCGDNCPASLGPRTNPYYDVSKTSDGLEEVNGNHTAWDVSFADERVASGFIAKERVALPGITVDDQVFGMITATNLTLSEQQISGLLGLGFPRLSILARTLLGDVESATSSSSNLSTPTNGASSTSTAATPSSSATSPYLPPFVESLVTQPHIPYPVFGLALSPPPNVTPPEDPAASPRASTPPRFSTQRGSLTFGGVSSAYFSNDTTSGRTTDDIEWNEVIPFGVVVESEGRKQTDQTIRATGVSNGTSTAPSATSSMASTEKRKRQSGSREEEDAVDRPSVPLTVEELGREEYLYWALQLRNVSVNSTNLGLESTYDDLGIPSIAILDAGFNGIAGPQQDVSRMFDQIPDARQMSTGQWAVPCNTQMTLGFSFDNTYVQLQPSDWIYAQISSSSFCLAWPLAVAATGNGVDWQLGTPFLKKVYSVFSYGINRGQAPLIGFLLLDALNETQPTPPNSTSSTSATPSVSTSISTPNPLSSLSTMSPTSFGSIHTSIVPASFTTTVEVELPNVVLADPAFATPSYHYSLDSEVTPGVLQSMGLGNATAYAVSEVPIVKPANASRVMSTSGSVGGIGVSGGGGQDQIGDSSAAGQRATVSVGGMLAVVIGAIGIIGL